MEIGRPAPERVTQFAIGVGGPLRHLLPYLGLNAEHLLGDPDGVEKRRRQKVVPHLSYEVSTIR